MHWSTTLLSEIGMSCRRCSRESVATQEVDWQWRYWPLFCDYFLFVMSGRHSNQSVFWQSTGNNVNGLYFWYYFFFFSPFPPLYFRLSSTFLTGGVLRWKNLFSKSVVTFPDPVSHFGAPWRPYWILQALRRCRRWASALLTIFWGGILSASLPEVGNISLVKVCLTCVTSKNCRSLPQKIALIKVT